MHTRTHVHIRGHTHAHTQLRTHAHTVHKPTRAHTRLHTHVYTHTTHTHKTQIQVETLKLTLELSLRLPNLVELLQQPASGVTGTRACVRANFVVCAHFMVLLLDFVCKMLGCVCVCVQT